MKAGTAAMYIIFIVGLAVAALIWSRREGFQPNPCGGHGDCQSCADAAGCGWCTERSECRRMMQDGYPERDSVSERHICNPFTFIINPEQCVGHKQG